jgi:hypothetical protein
MSVECKHAENVQTEVSLKINILISTKSILKNSDTKCNLSKSVA